MAFFLAGFPSKVPYQSAGANLGLISDGNTNAPASDQFIPWFWANIDIGNEYGVDEERQDHIAIDINSVKNSVNKTILPNNLTLDGKMTADISFDGSARMLVASLRLLDHPSISAPPIQVSAKLEGLVTSPTLPPQVAVGFSASTGFCQELGQILSWSFNSTLPLIDKDRESRTLMIDGGLIAGVVVLALAAWLSLLCWMHANTRKSLRRGTGGARRFEYRDLATATDHFSVNYKVGRGSFGVVYKGHLKLLGREVVVKKVPKEVGDDHKGFFAEVSTISEAKHKNLVKFFGWCCRGHNRNILHLMCGCCWRKKNEELFLVYEFVSNGNLKDQLLKEPMLLSWPMRYKIAKDIGSAPLYLHHECNPFIVHRDIKPDNILLDGNFNAKLADFGLSRIANPDNVTQKTMAAGTNWFMDPQYRKHGNLKLNRSSDVYSFGIVLLEIACTAKMMWEQIWSLYAGGGDVVEAADAWLASNGGFDRRQMERVIVLGLWCLALEIGHRPSILQAMDLLEREAPMPDLVNSSVASQDHMNVVANHPDLV
nr:protein kinase [Oryza brachyantha]